MKYKGERNRRKVLLAVFFTACVILAGTYTVSADDTTWPVLNFILPTPDNGNSQSVTNVTINVSINEQNLSELVYNWNGTNYTYYNDSLVLMMNFDKVSSLGESNTHVVDLTGNGNNGTVETGAIWASSGKYNGAFSFDGSTGQLDMGDVNELDGTQHFTISAWVKYNALGSWDYVFSKRGSSYLTNSMLMGSAGSGYGGSNDVFLRVTNGYTAWAHTSENILDAGVWHHWGMVYDGTQATNDAKLRFYFDGIQQSLTFNANIPTTTPSNDNPLVLSGWYTNTNCVNGYIDEFRVWSRSLSTSEIYQQYASNLNKFNSTQWYLYVNQSKNATAGLDTGTYTYQAFAKDINNNVNSTEERTIYILGASPPVPELSTIILMGTGLLMLIGYSGYIRKKKK